MEGKEILEICFSAFNEKDTNQSKYSPGVIAGLLISIDNKRAEQIPRYSDEYSAIRLLIILKKKSFPRLYIFI